MLLARHPDLFLPLSYNHVDHLAAFVTDLNGTLTSTLCGLAVLHPVLDEDDQSELEDEEVTASLAQYAAADLRGSLSDRAIDAWDRLSDDRVADIVWYVLAGLDYMPEHTGVGVDWDYDLLAAPVARAVLAAARPSHRLSSAARRAAAHIAPIPQQKPS